MSNEHRFWQRAARVGALAGLLAVVAIGCRSDPASSSSGEATTSASNDAAPSIGTATMQEDGTIVLMLRADAPSGGIGEARLTYPKTHKDYAKVLKHLGGLHFGETKPVPPWPDER